jgi:hypothetical protein
MLVFLLSGFYSAMLDGLIGKWVCLRDGLMTFRLGCVHKQTLSDVFISLRARQHTPNTLHIVGMQY